LAVSLCLAARARLMQARSKDCPALGGFVVVAVARLSRRQQVGLAEHSTEIAAGLEEVTWYIAMPEAEAVHYTTSNGTGGSMANYRD
jgi:hypothetical protein